MVRPDEITDFVDTRWFDTLAGLGSWVTNILLSLVILATFYFLYTLIEHRIKVVVFPIFGANPEEMKNIKSLDDLKDMPNIEIGMPKKATGREYSTNPSTFMDMLSQVGRPKMLRGKDIKDKSIKKFSLMKNLFVRKKLQEIPYEYRYSDGIWMINPAKDVYIPIHRPKIENTINMKVPRTDMDLWQQAEEAEIRRRTTDENTMKMQMYLTVAIIIGAFAIAGIIIWLSMSFAGRSINDVLDKIEPMTQALQNLVETRGPG